MLALYVYIASVTPSPSATDAASTKIPDPDITSPGFAGFLTVFLLTVATIFLIRSMTKHMRKVKYSPDPAGPSSTDQETPSRTGS